MNISCRPMNVSKIPPRMKDSAVKISRNIVNFPDREGFEDVRCNEILTRILSDVPPAL